jgi:hypothetical protein
MNNEQKELLKYYAGQALIGLLAADAGTYGSNAEPWFVNNAEEPLAVKAFKIAQAMVKEYNNTIIKSYEQR